MKLGRMHLQNFGPYEDCEVIFDEPLSILRSLDNAQGKTKLTQAIQLSLTEICAGVDGKGSGAADKIRIGANKAVLTAGLETAKVPMQLVTTYSPGRTQRIIPGQGGEGVEKLAEGFKAYLAKSAERLSCCLDSHFFIESKPADQKAILAALVLPTSYDFDPKMVELANKYLPGINWTLSPVTIIDQVYGDDKTGVYNARKLAKSTLAGIYIPQRPQQPEFTAQRVQEKLADLRAKQAKEAKKVKGGGTVQLGRAEQLLASEQDKLKAAHAERQEAVKRQAEIDAQLLDGPTLTKHKQVAAGRKVYDELASEIATVSQDIAEYKQAQDIFASMLQDEHGNPVDHAPCPTCTQTITRAFISGRIADHKKLEDAAIQQKGELEAKQKALGDIAGAEAALKAHEVKVQEKLEQVKKVTATEERIKQIEKAIGEYQVALDKAKTEQSAPADTSALDALNAEITQWEARLSPAVQYESTLKQIEESQKRWEEQNARVNDLESLCSYWGPRGVKSRLIAENIDSFQESANSVLGKWGYSIRLQFEPWSFDVATPDTDGKYLPLKELSGSELFRFCVSFQVAVAVASKIRMVLIDAADILAQSQQGQGILMGTLKSLIDTKVLDQAIVLSTDLRTEINRKNGVAYFRVEKRDKKAMIIRL
jgi:tetratricopeptide (TPR) repeat protein